jgi:Stage II sporulation protein E (SpoIIE)
VQAYDMGTLQEPGAIFRPQNSSGNFVGATRKQSGKDINDDAFAVFNGTYAFLFDGAGDAHGAATSCAGLIRREYEIRGRMPAFSPLLNILNLKLIGLNAESTFLGIEIKHGNFLSGISCGDSSLYVVRGDEVLRMNKSTKPRLGTCNPNFQSLAFPLQKDDVIILASDGFIVGTDHVVSTVRRNMGRPDSISETLLRAQRDCSDDVTIITKVV